MDDLIKRQDVIDAICTWDKFGVDERGRIVRWHEGLEPYVHLRDVVTAIVNLPSAEQKQKTGKWIREVLGSTSGYGTTVMYQCTNCEKKSISKYKFCPNCGARMVGEEE